MYFLFKLVDSFSSRLCFKRYSLTASLSGRFLALLRLCGVHFPVRRFPTCPVSSGCSQTGALGPQQAVLCAPGPGLLWSCFHPTSWALEISVLTSFLFITRWGFLGRGRLGLGGWWGCSALFHSYASLREFSGIPALQVFRAHAGPRPHLWSPHRVTRRALPSVRATCRPAARGSRAGVRCSGGDTCCFRLSDTDSPVQREEVPHLVGTCMELGVWAFTCGGMCCPHDEATRLCPGSPEC